MRKFVRLIVAILLSALVFAGVGATVGIVRKYMKEEREAKQTVEEETTYSGLRVLPMPPGEETAGWGELHPVRDEWTKNY